MKPDKLPLCVTSGNNTAIQNKLAQASKEVKMLQTQQQFSTMYVTSHNLKISLFVLNLNENWEYRGDLNTVYYCIVEAQYS